MQELLNSTSCPKGIALSTLDTRVKIGISVVASLATIAFSSVEALLVLVCTSILYAILLGKIRLLCISYIYLAIVAGVAYMFMMILPIMLPDSPVATPGAMLIPFMRMLIMLNVVLPLAFATKVQSLLSALRSFYLPIWLYIPVAVLIRFIPTCISDAKQIVESARIRGYDITIWHCCKHPRVTFRMLCVPLIFRALLSADALSIAAELKGIGYTEKMSTYAPIVWRTRDTIAVLLCTAILLCAGIVALYTKTTGGMMP